MVKSRTKLVSARLTEAEYAALEQAAGGQPLSVWARLILLRAATSSDHSAPTSISNEQGGERSQPQPPLVSDDADDLVPASDRAVLHALATSPESRQGRALTTRVLSSRVWLLTVMVLACFSGVSIATWRYVHVWTPLQRQYLWTYVWSGVALTTRGSYRFLIVVDRTERRTALDSDVTTVEGPDGFALSAAAIQRHAQHLEWERRDGEQVAVHAFLQEAIYHGQSVVYLARPALLGAFVVLLIGVLPSVVAGLSQRTGGVCFASHQRRPSGR
jgi:hypothetical protein